MGKESNLHFWAKEYIAKTKVLWIKGKKIKLDKIYIEPLTNDYERKTRPDLLVIDEEGKKYYVEIMVTSDIKYSYKAYLYDPDKTIVVNLLGCKKTLGYKDINKILYKSMNRYCLLREYLS